MKAGGDGDQPLLASLVLSGEGEQAAEPINDFIFMAKDISNAYLVTTSDGDVLVNTGFMDNAARNKAVLDPVRTGPLRAIILTQGHPDHFGGVPELREADTQIIAERRFSDTCEFFRQLMPYLGRRSARLWSGTIKRKGNPVPVVEPDIAVDGRYTFTVGNRRFELISTPGGEAPDSLTVWLPDERVVFTGNLFGPVFMSMPNLCTLRGDKPRSVQRFLHSLDTVRQLGAELLVTGHGEPIRGADNIRADLDKLHAAVSFVNEATIAGMNAGKDVYTLMREIRLPAELALGEYHGKIAWAVKTIWEGYSGWFHFDSTTSLYAVPRSSVDADLCRLAGGADKLAAEARDKLRQQRPLEAMHLLDIALGAEPANREALGVKRDALQVLLEASGGTNLSEVMWLKAEIAATESALANGH
jgi:glyoxylase-like metal-dependent hydrolase (beta-lactamase superfamily II)